TTGLLGVRDVDVLGTGGAEMGAFRDAEPLAKRSEFHSERPADIGRPVVVGLGEAVGLRLELLVLAAGDKLEWIELGSEVAACAIGPDEHAQTQRVAGGSDRRLLTDRA